jgi:U3 small nucleolar RNA-associated protein 22
MALPLGLHWCACQRREPQFANPLRAAPPLSPAQKVFKANFEVVLVDFTGWINVAAHMTRGSLAHAQLVARRTLELLNAPADPDEAFAAALLTRSNPAAAFDYHWRITLPPGVTWPVVKKSAAKQSQQQQQAVEAEDPLAEPGAREKVFCRDQTLWR